jgi:hypothetical protein
MTPLYIHTNEATSFLVADYPYGRKVRCRIRYWLENHPKNGFRFVSQTENPKTLQWNAPKKSTYMLFAGAMYRDDAGHVQWAGVSEYGDSKEARSFVERFPGADLQRLRVFAAKKMVFLRGMARGDVSMTINGSNVTTDADRERAGEEAEEWEAIANGRIHAPEVSI